MTRIRENLPIRRLVPTKNPVDPNWGQHKPDLKEDFYSHCAYCGCFDGYRHTYFEVDHFIPKSFFKPLGNITTTQYDNLVYSCKFCNNKKLSKWPTRKENVSHENDEGFIDPCDADYDHHLYRTADGGIMWRTNLGKWMATEAFKFDERDYSVKLLWNLNQTRKIIEALIIELNKRTVNSLEYNVIKQEAEKVSFEYVKFHFQLMDYYNSL